LIPAAGLRWLLLGQPRALWASEAFCGALGRLFPADRLAAFTARTGITLEQANSALLAGYDLATVYGVASSAKTSARVLSVFREHLREGGRVFEPHPSLRRVTGTAGDVPEALVTVGDHVSLVSVGDLTLARVFEAFALGRLERSRPALRGVALSRLPPPPAGSLAVLYVAGPFTGEWATAAGGVLSSTEALFVAAVPVERGAARFHLELVGEFPEAAAERVLSLASEVASSSTGKVLALDTPLEPPGARSLPGRLSFQVTLRTGPIADGLHAAVAGEAWQILNLPVPNPR
jgi:hypothetical protein